MKPTNGHPVLPPGIEHISQLPRPGAKSPRACGELIRIQEVLQRIIHEPVYQVDGRGDVLRVPAREIAQCSRQWGDLEELRMAKMGYGRPKSVEARNGRLKATTKPAASWEEPKQVQDAVVVVSKPVEVSKDVPVQADTVQHKPEST